MGIEGVDSVEDYFMFVQTKVMVTTASEKRHRRIESVGKIRRCSG